MCSNFFLDVLNERGGSKCTQGSRTNRKYETFLTEFSNKLDWIPILAMCLDFSLEIFCEVDGSNPLL